jgi:hypothetical protein
MVWITAYFSFSKRESPATVRTFGLDVPAKISMSIEELRPSFAEKSTRESREIEQICSDFVSLATRQTLLTIDFVPFQQFHFHLSLFGIENLFYSLPPCQQRLLFSFIFGCIFQNSRSDRLQSLRSGNVSKQQTSPDDT